MAPDVRSAYSNVVAAAAQLIASIRPPASTIVITAIQFHVPSCLRAAVELHAAEVLRDAGLQGLHVKSIAAPTGVYSGKLGTKLAKLYAFSINGTPARILRLLATNHIFTEVSPDVFANNRISSLLDTGKPIEEIINSPQDKYHGTVGIGALIEHATDDAFKTSSFLTDALTDPKWTSSEEPNQTALNLAFKTDLTAFEWFELPENARRLRWFGLAMKANQEMTPQDEILGGFEWKSLPPGAVIVDVGGGIGSMCLTLTKAHGHLSFVLQDREAIIKDAVKFWESEFPFAIISGRITMQRPKTQLVILDSIVSYACREPSSSITGSSFPPPPAPLLANGGYANSRGYLMDMQMLTGFNGSERTVPQFDKIFDEGGWKLVKVHRRPGTFSHIIGVPK
ncbi:hypothetical protein EW026_g4370 [Hermanssonia centrifuga]|uniref:S-adenosyl-L-methionine-dependent methyltransferase n=1 Tax=Hermanssonia centrifuga TaxID=98765 RepID=A0A4S4KHM9_9APHY|nr:hypothetical protein EW026_g4370 [Hermanssonia centrifuga]